MYLHPKTPKLCTRTQQFNYIKLFKQSNKFTHCEFKYELATLIQVKCPSFTRTFMVGIVSLFLF